MRRLGILHLATFLQGGAGRAIADLACAQHAAGHDVTVVTSRTPRGEFGNYPDHLERLRQAGVPLHLCDSLFTRDLAANLRVVEYLARTVDRARLDLVHAHAAVPAFIGETYAGGTSRFLRLLQTQHGWGINKTAEQASFDIDLLRRVDRVITTSRATADLLAGFGVPRGSTTVIPCGLPPVAISGPPLEAVDTIAPLRARGLRIVGCVGSVTANKNQRLLLDAMALISDAPIAVVGIGEGGEALARQARALGLANRFVACGYQPDAFRWLPLFDALAVPSRTEGQGLVVLEAFRAGVPVVASHIPALAELIDDGRSGLLFESDDAPALAHALRRVCTLGREERTAMTSAARTRFADDFSLEQMLARHEGVYRSLIAEVAEIAETV